MDSPRSALRELNDVGRSGRLDIIFATRRGRTIVRSAHCEIPYKITSPYYAEDPSIAHLIVMSSAPGLLSGDQVQTSIRVECQARAVVTTQASTKVHPGPQFAEQSLSVLVEPGAELHFYGDPAILFGGSRLRQRFDLEVSKDSRLYFWDGFMAGRIARGEAWGFHEFESETKVNVGERLLYLERFHLRPQSQRPDTLWAMNGFSYMATGLFYDARLEPDEIHFAVPEAGVDQPSPPLIVVRVLSTNGVDFRRIQERVLHAVFTQTGQAVPNLRKT
jgi:urease accessory protein